MIYSDYGWKIIWADPDLFDSNEIGTIGPNNIRPDLLDKLNNVDKNDSSIYTFDMYDDDDERYFAGILVGDDPSGDEPLIDYGTPYAGCTCIVTTSNDGKSSLMIS